MLYFNEFGERGEGKLKERERRKEDRYLVGHNVGDGDVVPPFWIERTEPILACYLFKESSSIC